jgi:uncharacterized protein (DUF1684 family)
VKTENPVPFDLPTSSGKTKSYQEFGKATFELDGKSYTLTVYQSLDLMKMEKYKDHLSSFSGCYQWKRNIRRWKIFGFENT